MPSMARRPRSGYRNESPSMKVSSGESFEPASIAEDAILMARDGDAGPARDYRGRSKTTRNPSVGER